MDAKEKEVFIETPFGALEGKLFEGTSSGALICHPHPLYGGDMESPIVVAFQRAFAESNFTTLRFNFRGVGKSNGHYGEGMGEAQDIALCYKYLKKKHIKTFFGAGYSFGSWVLLKAISQYRLTFSALVLTSPPVSFMDFEGLRVPPGPSLIIVGEKDEFCRLKDLHEWLDKNEHQTSSVIVTLRGEDHFLWSSLKHIHSRTKEFLTKGLQEVNQKITSL